LRIEKGRYEKSGSKRGGIVAKIKGGDMQRHKRVEKNKTPIVGEGKTTCRGEGGDEPD